DLDPRVGKPLARNDLVYLAVNEPGDRAGDRRAERLEQHAVARQVLGGEQVRVLIGVPDHIEVAGDLERDLVGQRILDRRIVDQRLNIGDIAAGVGDLIGAPYAQHGQRREHAADHDEHNGDRSTPADPPSATRAILLAAEL